MQTQFTGEDHVLLERFIQSVLLRFSDGTSSLADATRDLGEAFIRVAGREPDVLDHMRGVIEAGDDA
ncbi:MULTISPECIES: hypothetical protein [unclassified Caulobacter]|uniref:hypothetical protein n=1 Tax=unclassified Caulobacter TaxID=2648921 RepID=UPI000D3C4723|nr:MULTISPECIES: hypothetical protein [unclassified Caulobacter]PTS91191.1 hypothetical protein DBR21_02095 [Caulobacter sp. HMWF009]PTT12386.1 hypothetical protein DBR10_01615 [Caulobacter sp. HMWF025]